MRRLLVSAALVASTLVGTIPAASAGSIVTLHIVNLDTNVELFEDIEVTLVDARCASLLSVGKYHCHVHDHNK